MTSSSLEESLLESFLAAFLGAGLSESESESEESATFLAAAFFLGALSESLESESDDSTFLAAAFFLVADEAEALEAALALFFKTGFSSSLESESELDSAFFLGAAFSAFLETFLTSTEESESSELESAFFLGADFFFEAEEAEALEAGADFVKTSTGFGPAGATAIDVALMRRIVGPELGVKAAGGIRGLAETKEMIRAGATRIGASAGVKIVQSES